VDDRTMLQRETDDVDRHVAQIAEEFRTGFQAVARIDRPAVAVFGSARLPRPIAGARSPPRWRRVSPGKDSRS
jgi:hypothetical protein